MHWDKGKTMTFTRAPYEGPKHTHTRARRRGKVTKRGGGKEMGKINK